MRRPSSCRFLYFSTTGRTPASANTGSAIPSFGSVKSGISAYRKSFRTSSLEIGAALFHRDKQNAFPIPYKSLTGESWASQYAAPIGEATAPLSVSGERADLDDIRAAAPITVRADQKPRQGVNTCGANHAFIFDQYPDHLPRQFVFPLLTKECFRNAASKPQRFILLPYNTRNRESPHRSRTEPAPHLALLPSSAQAGTGESERQPARRMDKARHLVGVLRCGQIQFRAA